MSNTATILTVEESFSHWAKWTAADKALAAEVAAKTGAVSAYFIPSDGYVGWKNQQGVIVAHAASGAVSVLKAGMYPGVTDLKGQAMSAHIQEGWQVFLSSYSAHAKVAGAKTKAAQTPMHGYCVLCEKGWVPSGEALCKKCTTALAA